MESHLADVIEVSVRVLLHSLLFIELIEQLVCVKLAPQERQSVETKRLPNSITTSTTTATFVAIVDPGMRISFLFTRCRYL